MQAGAQQEPLSNIAVIPKRSEGSAFASALPAAASLVTCEGCGFSAPVHHTPETRRAPDGSVLTCPAPVILKRSGEDR